MQSEPTRPRRWARRAITTAVTAGILLVPTAALARPAHANELPQGPAQAAPGLQREAPNGNAYGRPAPAPTQPPADTTAPAVAILEQPTAMPLYGTATIKVAVSDDQPLPISEFGELVNGWVEVDGFLSYALIQQPDGTYQVTVNGEEGSGTMTGQQVTWRVRVTDAAGNQSVVEGQPILLI